MKRLIQVVLIILILHSVSPSHGKNNFAQLTMQLQTKLDRYKTDLGLLQQQVQSLKTKLEASKGQSNLSISQLQEGMANERDILNTIEGYLFLPFNVSLCQCYDLSETEKAKVMVQINSIKEKLTALETISQLNQTCAPYVEVQKELAREKRYILGIEQALTVSTPCGARPKKEFKIQQSTGLIDLAQSQYQTNLKAPGWCYGRLTPEQVKLLWFAYTVKNNIANCPLQTPYYDGTACIACTFPTGFFDLSKRKCINALAVDKDRKCVGVGEAGLKKETDEDKKQRQKEPEPVKEVKPPTFKDVQVDPLEADPIVKSITINKQKKTVDKIVEPIQGKALLDKEKKITTVGYEQVAPSQAEPDVHIKKIRKSKVRRSSWAKTSGLSSKTSFSSSQTSTSTGHSSKTSSRSTASSVSSSPSHKLWQF